MNQRGFTLIELLAVIAILAVLLIFAVPGVLKLYDQSRKDLFKIEVISIFDAAVDQKVVEATKGTKTLEYTSNDSDFINSKKELEYDIKFSEENNMKFLCVSNGKYKFQLNYENGDGIIDKTLIENGTILSDDEPCVQSEEDVCNPPFLARSIELGDTFSAALSTTNQLWMWGVDNFGCELLDPYSCSCNYSGHVAPSVIGNSFSKVSITNSHILATSLDGKLYSMGSFCENALGRNPTNITSLGIVSVSGDLAINDISSGFNHSLALSNNNTLLAWGSNGSNKLGIEGAGATVSIPTEISISGNPTIKSIVASNSSSFIVDNDGNIWGWGSNGSYQIVNDYDIYTVNLPTIIEIPGDVKFDYVFSKNGGTVYAIDEEGYIWSWGWAGSSGKLGRPADLDVYYCDPVPTRIDEIDGNPKFIKVSDGTYHALALDEDGYVWSWGKNTDGQLGDNTEGTRLNPQKVNFEDENLRFVDISAKYSTSAAVDSNGNIWFWGDTSDSKTGYPTTYESTNTPTKVCLPEE